MAIPSDSVISHWCKLLENFQASPSEFYSLVEEAVRRREIQPEISRIEWNESGVFSAKRQYLRVGRGRHVFDICGAPFGTGFFVSSWLVRPLAAHWMVAVFLLFLGAGITFSVFTQMFGFLAAPFVFVLGYPLLFWVFVQVMNQNREGWDDSIVAIPIVGALYERIFRPQTYYKIDTILMFQQSVHNAVLEVVDQMTSAKGIRALTELERKPVVHAFAKGAGS